MGLKLDLQSLVNDVITRQLGDLGSTARFKIVEEQSYDAATDTAITNTKFYDVKCLLTGLTQDDLVTDYADALRNMSGVVSTQRKILVPSAQLLGVQLDALDDLVVVDGVDYFITKIEQDPSGSLVKVYVKSQGGTSVGVG